MASLLALLPLALVPMAGEAAAQDRWVPVATTDVDPRTAGSRTVPLQLAVGQFRALRVKASADMELTNVDIAVVAASKVERPGPLSVGPRKPLAVALGSAMFVDTLTLTWPAYRDTAAVVRITIEGLQNTVEANARRPGTPTPEVVDKSTGGPTRSAGAPAPSAGAPGPSRGPASAPPPRQLESADADAPAPGAARPPPSRSIVGAAPPPGASPQPAPPRPTLSSPAPSSPTPGSPAPGAGAPRPPVIAAEPPRPTRGGEVAAANPCADGKVCTRVNVYFGTDRNTEATQPRVTFGAESTGRLTLGRAFVTVPKVRERGTLQRPGLFDTVFRRLPPEGDPARHFTLPKGGIKVHASEAEFLAEVKLHVDNAGTFKDHAFIYVHGFGVGFDDALYRAGQISYDLSTDGNPFGTAFVFSWPSRGSILPSAYLADQDNADLAVPHLRAFIELVSQRAGVKNVHIIAHSMGNRVLMRTIEQISLAGSTARLNQIVLAAPDVDKRQFETIAQNIGKIAQGATLYASKSDKAMTISRSIRQDVARAGDANEPPGPALVAGVDTIDISALSSKIFGLFDNPLDLGHDKYAESGELLADIAKLFTGGVRPPQNRDNRFIMLKQGTLQYWRFVQR